MPLPETIYCFIGPHPKAFSFFVKIRHRAPLTSYTEKREWEHAAGEKKKNEKNIFPGGSIFSAPFYYNINWLMHLTTS